MILPCVPCPPVVFSVEVIDHMADDRLSNGGGNHLKKIRCAVSMRLSNGEKVTQIYSFTGTASDILPQLDHVNQEELAIMAKISSLSGFDEEALKSFAERMRVLVSEAAKRYLDGCRQAWELRTKGIPLLLQSKSYDLYVSKEGKVRAAFRGLSGSAENEFFLPCLETDIAMLGSYIASHPSFMPFDSTESVVSFLEQRTIFMNDAMTLRAQMENLNVIVGGK